MSQVAAMNNFKSASFRHHRRHDSHTHRNSGSGSGNTSSKSNPNKYIRECACGRGLACVGMTHAFRLLGDPRCYYVELPRFRKDPTAYKYTFRNSLRAAYIRHLQKLNPNMNVTELENGNERRYVALHHFHPAVVKAFYENPLTSGAAKKHKVPISITEHELQELNMDIQQEDRILSVTGVPTGGYYFCPSYPQDKAHEDLKHLIKVERAKREERERQKQGAENKAVPEKIEISKTAPRPDAAVPLSPELRGHTSNPQEPEKSDGSDPNAMETLLDKAAIEKVILNSPFVALDDESNTEEIQASIAISSEKARPEADDEEEGDEFNAGLSENATSDFDSLWAEEVRQAAGSDDWLKTEQQVDHYLDETLETAEDGTDLKVIEEIAGQVTPRLSAENEEDQDATSTEQTLASTSRSTGRETDHPWETPKYRRHLDRPEPAKRMSSGPADFIDPTISTPPRAEDINDFMVGNETLQDSMLVDGDVGVANVVETEIAASEATVEAVKKLPPDAASAISEAALMAMQSIADAGENPYELPPQRSDATQLYRDDKDPPGWNGAQDKPKVSTPPRIQRAIPESRSFDDSRSQASEDSVGTGAITLKHNFPGTDPTLRIQVHNDLIAWESKRRTDMALLLQYQTERWQTLRNLLQEGLSEVAFAERFVSGFAKAGVLFADSTQAVYDDKLLDDAGNTVNNSFLQNRLYKKRNAQEYSIGSNDASIESGPSALLKSILDAQIEIAKDFRETSTHVEGEILPEIGDLRQEIQAGLKEFGTLGDSILAELKRSEIELKNIWDVFDAMVTGDLMEYTVHGSMHGGSQHGGSMHSSFGPSTGSLHGFLTPQGDGPIVSSVHSPMVKSTFRQLGALEDGWLVEMYYKSAVAYQKSVFEIAENEINNLSKRIINLEERRFRKLHQIILAFVPRQRRLFNALPEHLKGVLDDLVGLRIDEETLQTVIDESIRNRSHDHLKRGASHRSSIMNRSRLNKPKEAEESEVEYIESAFGDPFKSSMVLLSKIVELQPGGFRGMVNTTWKPSLVVVTSEGNFHVFLLPEDRAESANSPSGAFKSLYPPMDLDSPANWTRKLEISKSLTPTISISLKDSTFTVPKMQNRQLQVTEEKSQGGNGNNQGVGRNRFMKAMKAAADSQRSKRCTLRLPSSAEVNEWINLLERTKKVLISKDNSKKPSRFHF